MTSFYIALTILCNVFCVQCFSNVTIDRIQHLTDDNGLWAGLLKDCEKPTLECLKSSIYKYLKSTLEYSGDVQFTSFMKFSKNAIDYNKINNFWLNSRSDFEEHEASNKTHIPLEEISRSLSTDTKRFLMTHDIEVKLPESFFLGSSLKISPRSFDTNSAVVKLEVLPKELEKSAGEGRIFFKKIRKFISERLIWALLALLLVIKLLAVKVLFILPAILGVAAAKKLIIKVLLFLFPFLHNLFKLCAYTPYGAKHHIHKHQISHIHEVGHHHPHKHHHGHYGEVEVVGSHADGPPHHLTDFAQKDYYEPNGDGGYPEADPYYPHDVLHRRDQEAENEVDPWSQGHTKKKKKRRRPGKPPTASEIESLILKAEQEAFIKAQLQKEKQRIQEENLRLQEQLNNALKIQQQLKHHAAVFNKKIPLRGQQPFLAGPLTPAPHFVRPPISPQFSPHLTQYSAQLAPPNQFTSGQFAEPPDTYVTPSGPTLPSFNRFTDQQFSGSLDKYVPPVTSTVPPPKQFTATQFAAHQFTEFTQSLENYVQPDTSTSPNKFTGPHAIQGPISNSPSKTAQLAINFIQQQENNLKDQQIHPVYKPNVAQQAPVPDLEGADTNHHIMTNIQNSKTKISKKPSIEEEIYDAAAITYDPFYSPILEKIDKIVAELGIHEEPCKERQICKMYKNPSQYSPHSNLLSAELSRDSKELQKPSTTNAAVIRFYRYVQAARDGQDQRDCLRLYPTCAMESDV